MTTAYVYELSKTGAPTTTYETLGDAMLAARNFAYIAVGHVPFDLVILACESDAGPWEVRAIYGADPNPQTTGYTITRVEAPDTGHILAATSGRFAS